MGGPVILDRVVYENLRTRHDDAVVEGVAYLGIRKSRAGKASLAFRKPGSGRATLVEVGGVRRIVCRGHAFVPSWHAGWEKRAAEIEGFVAAPETAPLEADTPGSGLIGRLLGRS